MARRRSKRDQERAQFWRQVIGQWQASGQSVSAFCREHGLSEGGFYAWRKRFVGQEQGPTFVPVRVIPDTGVEPEAAAIEVALVGGRLVRIRPGFDPETLKRLLGVLEGRPC